MPPAAEFGRLGVRPIRELYGGHQSRVVLAEPTDGSGGRLVIKLIDATTVDRKQAIAALQVRDRAASYDDRVVPLVSLAGTKVNRIANCLAIASPFVNGRVPDVATGGDGAYDAAADQPISVPLIDIGLQARADALRYWLRNLDEAPIGIRNASPDWHRHLQAFCGTITP